MDINWGNLKGILGNPGEIPIKNCDPRSDEKWV